MSSHKTKPIIAVDLDDVLSDQNESIREFANKTYGHNHSSEDYLVEGQYWGYWDNVWGVDAEEAERRINEYLDDKGSLRQLPIQDVSQIIDELKERYDLVIITSRRKKEIELTHEWLDMHFPATFKGVHFVQAWQGSAEATKATICKEIGAEYLIDDNLEHCTLAAEEGVQALLFGEYGWSKTDMLPKGIVRVKDWQAVKRYFDGQPR